MHLSVDYLITTIDNFTDTVGRALSWLVLFLVLLTCYDVTMRYAFHQGSVAFQELEWHVFAALFLLGGAYTLKHDAHVRVDILYQSRWVSDKGRAYINIFGTLLFLFPFAYIVISSSWPFVETSFHFKEGSPDPGGLAYRFIIKSTILLSFALMMIQGLAELLKQVKILQTQETA